MKILSNPIYRLNNQIKSNSINTTNKQSSLKEHNLNALECMSNYNIPFCSHGLVYAINYDGSCEKFENAMQAANKYKNYNVYRCLRGETYVSCGKVFVYADKNKNITDEVAPEIVKRALLNFGYANNQPIYSIDVDGNLKRYESARAASNELSMPKSEINAILSDNLATIWKYTFVKALDVETRDEKGKLLFDENNNPTIDVRAINKAREKFLQMQKNALMIRVSKDGEIKRYKNLKEVMADMGCSYTVARNALFETKIIQEKYILLRLEKFVKTDENGDVVYDENNDFQLDYDEIAKAKKMYFDSK